jgi:threonine synthase
VPWEYRCESCNHRESIDAPAWRCAACGGAFALDGPNQLAPDSVDRADATLWRYGAILPVSREHARTLGEGMTPLVAGTLAGRDVWFKHDALLPTGSFKDRGAAVLVAHLRRLGLNRVIVDSSGNAAAAMAGYSAAAGLDCTVYAPATTSPGKLVQSRAFGATVVLVEGNREAVARTAQDAAAADPAAFYASHNWHAVFVEGVKTWALEVSEQLGGRNPAVAFVPTGGGSAFVGAWRGFAATGDPLPRLIAAQPAACAPIIAAHTHGAAMSVTPGATIAEGTHIATPSRPKQILAALDATGGHATAVTEDQIIATLRELWGQGLYVEPTAAVGAAACRAALEQGQDFGDGPIVVLLTGSGLKATESISTLV